MRRPKAERVTDAHGQALFPRVAATHLPVRVDPLSELWHAPPPLGNPLASHHYHAGWAGAGDPLWVSVSKLSLSDLGRTCRSALADALALPGFTFGLDWVGLVGHVRLGEHLSLDQTHAVVQERLARWQLSISRREILYLFDAYCTLFRVAQEWSSAPPWREEIAANGGVILAIDGIQSDKGNETIYLVRDVLTGRLFAAENLLSSEATLL